MHKQIEDTRGDDFDPNNVVDFWRKEGRWPRQFFEPDLELVLTGKLFPDVSSTTPSDRLPREEKCYQYRDWRYEYLLSTKGSFMAESKLGVSSKSRIICRNLLERKQTFPENSLFRDDIFNSVCNKICDRDDGRIKQDISRLIVPSAETLAMFGAKHLDILVESVDEGWRNSIPVAGMAPQPDYSVGFGREAFTKDQLDKLGPFVYDATHEDAYGLSFFMATWYMYFPFLTCEVREDLYAADRHNAHSMTLAVRAVAELFRAMKREDEVNRQILGFSVSHNHEAVQIYGHYPVIDEKGIKYHRHCISSFFFNQPDGAKKWAAYQFIKNVYDIWMPYHWKRICSVIDQLPPKAELEAWMRAADSASPLSDENDQLASPGPRPSAEP
ncbi:hypothetical protein F4860DRAFT_521591 [Xylaria cubensis]|nr:hypothetical protein F4860DRAFT_521591 [Xylaria cubensis]